MNRNSIRGLQRREASQSGALGHASARTLGASRRPTATADPPIIFELRHERRQRREVRKETLSVTPLVTRGITAIGTVGKQYARSKLNAHRLPRAAPVSPIPYVEHRWKLSEATLHITVHALFTKTSILQHQWAAALMRFLATRSRSSSAVAATPRPCPNYPTTRCILGHILSFERGVGTSMMNSIRTYF
jgi:hypothetical protein